MIILCSCAPDDAGAVDGDENRSGFRKCFGVPADASVTGVYFFADEWGGDAKYWLAFSAPQAVMDTLIQKLELRPAHADWNAETGGSADSLPWWDVKERRESDYYLYDDDESEVQRQLWYNPRTQRCQAVITYW